MIMSAPGETYIAGSKTTDDWRRFSSSLVPGGDRAVWQIAFDEYFHARLSLRYLDPIRILQENGTFQGEGFSIVAIQCTLIEFLESTIRGLSYRYLRKGETLRPPRVFLERRSLRQLSLQPPAVREGFR